MYLILLSIYFFATASSNYSSIETIISRIVGGVDAKIEEAPWQVAIHYYPINYCGGAIISNNAILTVAHCFVNREGNRTDPKAFKIRAGTERRSVGGILHKVNEIILHPKFNASTYFFDIAILKLETKIHFTSKIQPIPLPGQNEKLPIGRYGMVTGWGRLKTNGSFPKILQKVFLPILHPRVCKKAYAGVAEIIDEMFCAGTFDGLKDTCNGDSGGPFVVNNKLFGLTSFGIKCASLEYPGVFTAVNKFYNWIIENIK